MSAIFLIILVIALAILSLASKLFANFIDSKLFFISNKINLLLICGYLIIVIGSFFVVYLVSDYRGDINHNEKVFEQISYESFSEVCDQIDHGDKEIEKINELRLKAKQSFKVNSKEVALHSKFPANTTLITKKTTSTSSIQVSTYVTRLNFGGVDLTDKFPNPSISMDEGNIYISPESININGVVFETGFLTNQFLQSDKNVGRYELYPPKWLIYIELPKGTKLLVEETNYGKQ